MLSVIDTHRLAPQAPGKRQLPLILAAACLVSTHAYAVDGPHLDGPQRSNKVIYVSRVGRGASGAAKIFLHATTNPGRGVTTRGDRWRGLTLDIHGQSATWLAERRRDGSIVSYGFDQAGDLQSVQRTPRSGPTQHYDGSALQALLERVNVSGSSWHGGFRTYEAMPGEHVSEAASRLAEIAQGTDRVALAMFNGVTLAAKPGDSADQVLQSYGAQRDSHRPSGSAQRRHEKWRRRAAAKQLLRERELASGLGELKLANHKGWAKARKINSDGYGKAVLDYAERWARLLQREIDRAGINDARKEHKGDVARVINEHAERLSHVADTEGITGFMHGAAVATLARTWKHGDALRRWHNLSTQLQDEGVEANRGRGVLNPAVVRLR